MNPLKKSFLPLFLAAALLTTGCQYVEVDGIGTRTYDEEFVPQEDITAFNGCSRNAGNQWVADGAVTNHTPDLATYAITVAFEAADGSRVDERTMWIRDLAPGQVGEMNRGWWISNPDNVASCRVLTINRTTQEVASPTAVSP